MDDSTYMSQTDMTLPVSDASRPFRVQVSEAMLGYSPAMSSQSQGTYHGAQSDVSQMFLPAAAAGSYLGDSNFAVAGFTNTSNDQFYGQPTGFVPRHPTAVHYPQATEGRGDHIGSAGVHRTNNLFAATSGDGSVLPSYAQKQLSSRGVVAQQAYIPYATYFNGDSNVAASRGLRAFPGAPPKRKQGTRKRKSAADGEEQVDKRQRTAPGKVSDAANSALAIQKQRKLHFQRLCAEFNTRLLALRQRLEVIQGPLDFPADIATEVAMLDNLKQQVTEMSSNQPLLPHLVSPLLDID
ncbi:hypothetical protein H2199_006705 [Coniosporium tulheliwenetii]|uniref:Uncharacterized protein n=1 Tax=Coniosporium tulheliwenetii TaxID=3383036 RepID=A0ACC2YUB3_9PEZI|nr:hypothetical protein H2199_006705 [Cladosporium sp. JES 115]